MVKELRQSSAHRTELDITGSGPVFPTGLWRFSAIQRDWMTPEF